MYVFCFYLQLRYNPISSGFSVQQTIQLGTCEPTEPVAPTVSLSCNRRVDIITGFIEIHINWTYEYNPLIEEAISEYNIFYTSIIDGSISIGNNIPLDPQVNPLSVHTELCTCSPGVSKSVNVLIFLLRIYMHVYVCEQS